MNVGEAYRKYDRRGGHRDQRAHQHFQGGAPGGQYYGCTCLMLFLWPEGVEMTWAMERDEG